MSQRSEKDARRKRTNVLQTVKVCLCRMTHAVYTRLARGKRVYRCLHCIRSKCTICRVQEV